MRNSANRRPALFGSFAILALLFFGSAALYLDYALVTSVQVIYSLLIIFLGILPSVIAFAYKTEIGLMPLVPLHGIFYAFTFGLPVLSDKTDWLSNDGNDISYSLLLTIFGLIFLYIGYYATRSLFSKAKCSDLRNLSPYKRIYLAWALFGLYLSFQFFPLLRSIPSVEQLSAPLGYMSLGILFLALLDQKLSRYHALCIAVAIGFTLLIKTLSGSLALTVFLMVFLAALYWNSKHRIPWHFGVAVVLFAALLNPLKMEYRSTAWADNSLQMSYYEKAILMSDTIQNFYSGSNIFNSLDEDSTTLNRLAHIVTFGHVVSLTPSAIPHWGGDSYRTLWTSFVPRILWPDKPKANIGQDFGHRYGLIAPNNEWTSINLPWIVEFYANFGEFGVLVGMFFVGVFFRFIVHKLSVPVNMSHQHVLGVTVMFGLFYAESNFSLMVGGILSTYIFFLILLSILSTKSPSPIPRDKLLPH